MKTLHVTHPKILKRLKRAVGHLNGVIAMMQDERPCLELAQQLHAVESAVANAKKTLIHDHVNHCLDESVSNPSAASRRALEDFKAISKSL